MNLAELPGVTRLQPPPSPEGDECMRILCVAERVSDWVRVQHSFDQYDPNGFQLAFCQQLPEALARLGQTRFDVVLLHAEPDDDLDLAAAIRKLACEGAPVIVVSRDDCEDAAFASIDAGAEDFIAKTLLGSRQFARSVCLSLAKRSVRDVGIATENRPETAPAAMERLLAESADLTLVVSMGGRLLFANNTACMMFDADLLKDARFDMLPLGDNRLLSLRSMAFNTLLLDLPVHCSVIVWNQERAYLLTASLDQPTAG